MSASTVIALAVAAALILGSCSDLADSGLNPDQQLTLGIRPVLKIPGVGSSDEMLTTFDDLKDLNDSILTVHSITIASSNQIDSIQFSYVFKNGSIYRPPARGEGHTVPQTIKLAEDEYVAKIEGTAGSNQPFGQVYITIKNPNNKSRVYGPYGANVGERNFTFEGYILGIHGKIDPPNTGYRRIVRNLGVYQLAPVKESGFFSDITLTTFYENPDMIFPPVVKISKMFIRHDDDGVYSLQVEYQHLDGSTRLGGKYGSDRGNLTTISLEYGEELSGLKGELFTIEGPAFEVNIIGKIIFTTRKKNGSTAAYGPFGKRGNIPISVDGHILGFSGSAILEFIASLSAFYYV